MIASIGKLGSIGLIIIGVLAFACVFTACGGGGGGGSTPPPPEPPLPPAGVDATDGSYSDKVKVSWYEVKEADYYTVYRHTSSDSSTAKPVGANLKSMSFSDYTALPSVTYYYWIKASNKVGDSKFSAHNTGYAKKPLNPKANLYVKSVNAPMILWTANNYVDPNYFSVGVVIKNNGDADAPYFRLGVYLSKDTYLDNSDYYFCHWNCSLSKGHTTLATARYKVYENLPNGHYYVLAIVDDKNQVNESNESDNGAYFGNVLVNSYYKGGSCDFASSGFKTNTLTMVGGTNNYVLYQALNNSPVSYLSIFKLYTKLYLSSDSIIKTSDKEIASSWTLLWSKWTYKTIAGDVLIPDVSPGLYYLGGFSDATGRVTENYEGNNTMAWPIIIK